LFIAGGLVVSFAGGRYAMGAATQDDARRAWDDAHRAVDASRNAALRGQNPGPLVEGAPVARLIIPKIGLDEIVLEGVTDLSMNGGPGHFPGSPLPGESGNAVISAHRDRHFRKFDALAVGDTIRTEAGAMTSTWVVVSRKVIDKDTPALFPSRDARLTLTTCWPIRYLGTAPDRLIITAKPISG
jgi:sortase A